MQLARVARLHAARLGRRVRRSPWTSCSFSSKSKSSSATTTSSLTGFKPRVAVKGVAATAEEVSELASFLTGAGKLEEARSPLQEEQGRVVDVAGGIATVRDLPAASLNGAVQFVVDGERTMPGMVMHLGPDIVSAAILGSPSLVRRGASVRVVERELGMPVGGALLGRTVDVLGRPRDNRGELVAPEGEANELVDETTPRLPLQETRKNGLPWRVTANDPAPSLMRRGNVNLAYETGYLVVDMFQPLGAGLRFGLFGPKSSGKAELALDMVRGHNRMCKRSKHELYRPKIVYVSIGKSAHHIKRVQDRLERYGLTDSTSVITATETDSLGEQYLAPFAGMAAAAHWRARGQHAIVIFDELTAHGFAHQQLVRAVGLPFASIRTVHQNLLERAAPLVTGGSVTAICLADSPPASSPPEAAMEHSLKLQIVENVASAADHLLHVDPELSTNGVRPPVSTQSISMMPRSRFKSSQTQQHVSREALQVLQDADRVSRNARDAAEFGFEPEVDTETELQFHRKLQAMLTQPGVSSDGWESEPMSLSEQVASTVVWSDVLYTLDEEDVLEYRLRWLDHLQHEAAPLMQQLDEAIGQNVRHGKLLDELREQLVVFHGKWLSEHQ